MVKGGGRLLGKAFVDASMVHLDFGTNARDEV